MTYSFTRADHFKDMNELLDTIGYWLKTEEEYGNLIDNFSRWVDTGAMIEMYYLIRKQQGIINKAIEELKQGITFCENDSQGLHDKCNISINREKKILSILEESGWNK